MPFSKKLYYLGVVWLLMWLAVILYYLVPSFLLQFGLVPRSSSGVIGIITHPFLHGGWRHFIGNSIAFIPLSMLVLGLHPRKGLLVWALIPILSGGLMWLFAGTGNHIGASGWVYGLVSFSIVVGWFKRSARDIGIGVVVAIVYSGLFWGLFPTMLRVSWEGHLFGAIIGVLLARIVFSPKNLKNVQ